MVFMPFDAVSFFLFIWQPINRFARVDNSFQIINYLYVLSVFLFIGNDWSL